MSVAVKAAKHVPAAIQNAQRHACVLYAAVRIEQLGPHRADLGTAPQLDHRFEPPRLHHLDVVVEEHQQRGAALAHRGVVYRGVVEWPAAPIQIADGVCALPGPHQPLDPLAPRIVDHQHFPVRVGCLRQRRKAGTERTLVPARGDENAGLRPRRDRVAHPQPPRSAARHHRSARSKAAHVVLHRPPSRFGSVGLRLRTCRGRPPRRAPVVEHPGNVRHLRRERGHPQNQVVVLRSVVLRPESARLLDQVAAGHQQVRTVVFREQQLGRPVRFEERVVALARRVDLVFVRIQEAGAGMVVDRIDGAEEGVRRQFVVLVEQRHVLAAAERQGGVRCGGDSTRCSQLGHAHARVVRRGLSQHRRGFLRARAVVRQAQFPVRVALGVDGCDGALQVGRRRPVDRDQDAHERALRERPKLELHQRIVAALEQPDPLRVLRRGGTRFTRGGPRTHAACQRGGPDQGNDQGKRAGLQGAPDAAAQDVFDAPLG